MQTLLIALGSFVAYFIAYHTYGRWLARKLFRLDPDRLVPSRQINDGVDYVPTRPEVLYGHHFASIAGTGPIVGPALAIMWGWVPAVIWVLVGNIFIGAVHDFGALVISVRNRGQTLGEIAGRLINPRVKVLFLLVLFLALLIVLAIFGMVIASVFKNFPVSVAPVWLQLPLAIGIGWWTYRRGGHLFWPALIVLATMYLTVWGGTYFAGLSVIANFLSSIPLCAWVIILLIYSYIASVLPVTTLLQPRDYINSHQLILAMALLAVGIGTAAFFGLGGEPLEIVAPAIDLAPPQAPPIWPFLFITIACGAVSGFHSMVSSGTSSKQLARESDALFVGYGAMLTEGALAIMVICAVGAGIGLGNSLKLNKKNMASFHDVNGLQYNVSSTSTGIRVTRDGSTPALLTPGEQLAVPGGKLLVDQADGATKLRLTGKVAWKKQYSSWMSAKGLGAKVGAFIHGAGNFLGSFGVPAVVATAIIAVLVASFASTTLDTATRLQRYVVTELATTLHLKPLATRHGATFFAVATAATMALLPPPGAIRAFMDTHAGASLAEALYATSGTGGLLLWPLFGAANQLLAGLAFMVITFYLLRRNRPFWMVLIPAILMLIMPGWAMVYNVKGAVAGGDWHLAVVGATIVGLELWMVVEAALMWRRARGRREPELPPLENKEPPADYVEVNP